MAHTKIFLIGDTHFGQANIITFLNYDGTRMRPFGTVEDMNQTIIDRWNETVGPYDHVYHLGDVVMKKEYLEMVKQLSGKKRLVLGNHDIFDTQLYLNAGFEKLCGVRVFPGLKAVLTHVPMHPESIKEGWINVHGHLHNNLVMDSNGNPDPRYLNVCCERVDYTPIELCKTLMEIRGV